MRNTICAALTATTLALCTALAGCGSAAKPSTTAHAADTGVICSASQSGIMVCTVTLSDTRQVDCVITAGTYGKSGVTCDWSHVSGADKEPAR